MHKYTAQFQYTDDGGETLKLMEMNIKASDKDVAFNLLDPLAISMGKSVGEYVYVNVYDYEEEN